MLYQLLLVAVLVAIVVVLSRTKKTRSFHTSHPTPNPLGGAESPMLRRLLLVVAVLLALVLVFSTGLLVGYMRGLSQERVSRYDGESNVLTPVLRSNPGYLRVEIYMYTGDGIALLAGTLDTQAEYDRLRSRVVKLLGESRIDERFGGLSVIQSPLPPVP